MKRTIRIIKNICGDSRSAEYAPNIRDFDESNRIHAEDVEKMMYEVADEIKLVGRNHDNTKIYEPMRSLFYRELCDAIDGKIDFTDGKWYKEHCERERHHLDVHCPDDVNLIDVIEMVCDHVCAGMARTGDVFPVNIPSDVLQKAVENTVNMCAEWVEVDG